MTATMAASLDSRHFFPTRADALTAEDFETASIRSAAPSYSELRSSSQCILA